MRALFHWAPRCTSPVWQTEMWWKQSRVTNRNVVKTVPSDKQRCGENNPVWQTEMWWKQSGVTNRDVVKTARCDKQRCGENSPVWQTEMWWKQSGVTNRDVVKTVLCDKQRCGENGSMWQTEMWWKRFYVTNRDVVKTVRCDKDVVKTFVLNPATPHSYQHYSYAWRKLSSLQWIWRGTKHHTWNSKLNERKMRTQKAKIIAVREEKKSFKRKRKELCFWSFREINEFGGNYQTDG